ncbi:MAG: hypothetical protein RQ715_01185 [Methylococcales bacterium]|nr:hypothetical protein [Methylococcales bacterium]
MLGYKQTRPWRWAWLGCIAAMSLSSVYADITIGGKSQAEKQTPKTIKVAEKMDIDGYVDGSYIRLAIDVLPNKDVVGYLFEGKKRTYIYGQKVQGALHMYSEDGRHITVVPSK